tara:strand:- start:1666 stop:2058 length:393 start_codon:yes stop_codon:yes gene_type:complete
VSPSTWSQKEEENTQPQSTTTKVEDGGIQAPSTKGPEIQKRHHCTKALMSLALSCANARAFPRQEIPQHQSDACVEHPMYQSMYTLPSHCEPTYGTTSSRGAQSLWCILSDELSCDSSEDVPGKAVSSSW